MTEGNFEIRDEDFKNADDMAPEVINVEGVADADLDGQIKSLESEIETLEAQYDPLMQPRIDALKRRLQELKEKIAASE